MMFKAFFLTAAKVAQGIFKLTNYIFIFAFFQIEEDDIAPFIDATEDYTVTASVAFGAGRAQAILGRKYPPSNR